MTSSATSSRRWAADRPVSLAQQLWRANADWADRILAHPFVQGLGDGSLPVAAFKSYVAQDAYFLDAFARAYAFCLAHGTSRDDLFGFSELIAGVLEELKLHKSYTETPAGLARRRDAAAGDAGLCRLPAGTARRGQLGETIAGMTPCMRLYAFLGQTLAKKDVAPAYADWVKTYADPGFEALAVRLEGCSTCMPSTVRWCAPTTAARWSWSTASSTRTCRAERRQLLHRPVERAVQVGGELAAHRRPHFLLGIGPQRQRPLEQRPAGRRRDQLVPALVARARALDQPVDQQRLRLRVRVVRSVASSSDSRPIETGPSAAMKPSSENCEILRPVGAEVLAVDRRHAAGGAADAEAGAFGGREAQRGGTDMTGEYRRALARAKA